MAYKSLPLPEAFGLRVSQAEVDFVIPDLASDIPVCIDPFLLFKSRDATLRDLHGQLTDIFAHGFDLHARGDRQSLDKLIDFPEVNAIGFGYSRSARRGSGLGWHLNQLVADLLESNEEIRVRGLRHIEELQLLSVGVGPDRVSDIAANVLKLPLIRYTQEQAAIWDIPVRTNVPVAHFFDRDEMDWSDGYFDLPVSPISGEGLILVPRRIVRLLPWINYGDFYSSEAQSLLPPRPRRPRYPGMTAEKRSAAAKVEMVERLRGNTQVLDQYVNRKESEASGAEPLLQEIDARTVTAAGESLLGRLHATKIGPASAGSFQRLVYEIVNFVFEPELTAGQMEVATHLGTERRDIIYWNEAELSFWAYVRNTYNSPLIMFECKNVADLNNEHVNQAATYLGARLGMLGFIVARRPPSDAVLRKTYSVYNDSPAIPRKTILVLTDSELASMITEKVAGNPATRVAQEVYRRFRQRVQ